MTEEPPVLSERRTVEGFSFLILSFFVALLAFTMAPNEIMLRMLLLYSLILLIPPPFFLRERSLIITRKTIEFQGFLTISIDKPDITKIITKRSLWVGRYSLWWHYVYGSYKLIIRSHGGTLTLSRSQFSETTLRRLCDDIAATYDLRRVELKDKLHWFPET